MEGEKSRTGRSGEGESRRLGGRRRGQVLHEAGQPLRRLFQNWVQQGRVPRSQLMVQLEVDKLQQRVVEIQKRHHHFDVHVMRNHLRDPPARLAPALLFSNTRRARSNPPPKPKKKTKK